MQTVQTVRTMQIVQTDQIMQMVRTMQAAQAAQRPPVRVGPTTSAMPPVTVASTTVAPAGQSGITGPAHPIVLAVNPAFPERPGGLVHATDVPGPPSASSLAGPSLAEAAGARASGLGLGRLDPSSVSSGTTAAYPPISETIVTPSLAGTSSFWLQPVDPVPAPGSVPFDFGLHHAGEGASHPAPPPPAPGRTGTSTVAPPPAADAWRIRPPGMGGGPRPVAFDPWSAPPGPSSQVVYTEATGTPVMSTGAPPGGQGAETPGFARAAAGAVELPFSQREAIARRFRTENEMLEAELALRTGGAGALGWSAMQRRWVLDDISRLHDTARTNLAAAAARVDIDWSAIDELMPILDVPPPSP